MPVRRRLVVWVIVENQTTTGLRAWHYVNCNYIQLQVVYYISHFYLSTWCNKMMPLLTVMTTECNTSMQFLSLCRHESSSCLEFELSGYPVSVTYDVIVTELKCYFKILPVLSLVKMALLRTIVSDRLNLMSNVKILASVTRTPASADSIARRQFQFQFQYLFIWRVHLFYDIQWKRIRGIPFIVKSHNNTGNKSKCIF